MNESKSCWIGWWIFSLSQRLFENLYWVLNLKTALNGGETMKYMSFEVLFFVSYDWSPFFEPGMVSMAVGRLIFLVFLWIDHFCVIIVEEKNRCSKRFFSAIISWDASRVFISRISILAHSNWRAIGGVKKYMNV